MPAAAADGFEERPCAEGEAANRARFYPEFWRRPTNTQGTHG